MVARSKDALDVLADDLRSHGSTVGAAALDLTDQATITPTLERLLKSHQPPQLLINNAGAAYTGDLVSTPLERWNWLIQLNLTSVLQVCSVVVPAMRATGGLVINVSSHAANNAFPQWGAYCISKAALASFTVEGVHGADLAHLLTDQGIAVRNGHHCAMPLLKRLGLPGAIRVSLGLYNDGADLERFFAALDKALELLR